MVEIKHTEEKKVVENKKAPCMEKGCSWCCDPVKIPYSKMKGFDERNLREAGTEELWEDTGEVWIPEKHPDSVRVKTYECKNFDKESGVCVDYENRPNICRNTSCVKEGSEETEDEQYNKQINEKFFKLK